MEVKHESLISVIVPIYNAESYLRQCIDSILKQTYEQLDILFVDDGSTDSSGKICDEYRVIDPRVRVIHKRNEGLMKARKIGVNCAKGDYVTFVDADDWIEPNTYLSMLKNNKGCDVIACGIYRYYNPEDIKQELPGYKEGYYHRQSIHVQMLPDMLWKKEINKWNLDPSLCTKLFKKELLFEEFEHADGMDCYFGEDTVIFFPLMLRVNTIQILSQSYYYHRQRRKGEIPPYIQDENFFDRVYQVYQYLKGEFIKLGYWNIMKNQLEHFYLNALEQKRVCYEEASGKLQPVFPFWMIPKGAEVVLYGAGKVGKAYVEQNERNHFCRIILWTDQDCQNIHVPGYYVEHPEKIKDVNYDYIVIAIDIRETAAKVKEDLKRYGVSDRQIIWHSIRQSSF